MRTTKVQIAFGNQEWTQYTSFVLKYVLPLGSAQEIKRETHLNTMKRQIKRTQRQIKK